MASHPPQPRICPWWLGYFFITPLRRIFQNPASILTPHVQEGMTVLEIGPGMGYFSLPLAKLVGETGKVLCVDIQRKMIEKLEKRAGKAGLGGRIKTVLASKDSFNLGPYEETVDFTFAFAMVHEVPDQDRLFHEVYRAMKPEGVLFLSEPKGHVSEGDFRKTIELAEAQGFRIKNPVDVKGSLSMLFRK